MCVDRSIETVDLISGTFIINAWLVDNDGCESPLNSNWFQRDTEGFTDLKWNVCAVPSSLDSIDFCIVPKNDEVVANQHSRFGVC